MNYITSKSFFALLLLSFFFVETILHVHGDGEPYDVHIVNRLPDKLRAHCFSADDDLGFRTLDLSEDWNWHFRMALFERTAFYCHFWWFAKQGGFAVFDSKISDYCGHSSTNECNWEVREDGFYLFDRTAQSPKFFKANDWY
nr:S-protein homolog 3-like [Coffea arabica]